MCDDWSLGDLERVLASVPSPTGGRTLFFSGLAAFASHKIEASLAVLYSLYFCSCLIFTTKIAATFKVKISYSF